MYTQNIKGFTLYTRKPNAIAFGSLYIRKVYIPFSPFPNRTLRVWLPNDYDGKKKYGVIYMSDGQNIVDKFTSLYGEWNMENHIQNLQDNGYDGFIVVGIDCPPDYHARMEEYSPYKIDAEKGEGHSYIKQHAYGNLFAEYVIKKIIPIIENNFVINRDLVGFLGSSMGGLFSFYICSRFSEIFKFSLCFSSAFMLYKTSHFKAQLNKWNPNPSKCPKYFIYSGSKNRYEKQFVRDSKILKKFLTRNGFNNDQVRLIIDKNGIHNESSWSNHVEEALYFVLSK